MKAADKMMSNAEDWVRSVGHDDDDEEEAEIITEDKDKDALHKNEERPSGSRSRRVITKNLTGLPSNKEELRKQNERLAEQLRELTEEMNKIRAEKRSMEIILQNIDSIGRNNMLNLISRIYGTMAPVKLQQAGVQKSGMLMKQGTKIRNWKYRHFILKDKFLMYYESPHDEKALGVMYLVNQTVEKVDGTEFGLQFSFSVKTPERVRYCAADTELDMQDWITKISEAKSIW